MPTSSNNGHMVATNHVNSSGTAFTSTASLSANSSTSTNNNNSLTGIDPQAWLATLLVKLNQAVFSDIGKSLFVRHR
jgi:hypothetical protein